MLQCQPAARIDVRSVTLLIQGTEAEGEQAGKDRKIGAWPGAAAGRDTLRHGQCDPRETECEPDPLKWAYHVAKQGTPE